MIFVDFPVFPNAFSYVFSSFYDRRSQARRRSQEARKPGGFPGAKRSQEEPGGARRSGEPGKPGAPRDP